MLITYSKTTVFDRLKPFTLSAVGKDRMLRNKLFIVCKCPGDRDTINCQMPGPRDSSCIKCPGFARGDARGWNWLALKVIIIVQYHTSLSFSLTVFIITVIIKYYNHYHYQHHYFYLANKLTSPKHRDKLTTCMVITTGPCSANFKENSVPKQVVFMPQLRNSTSNDTGSPQSDSGVELIIESSLLSVLSVLILSGNILVCMAFRRHRKLRTTTNSFLISLAIADIMVGAFSVPYWIYFRLGKFLIKLSGNENHILKNPQ